MSPAGELFPDRVIVPVNPLRLVRVIVEVAVDPALTLSELGLADILRSPVLIELTVTVIVVWWDRDPLVPVVVTV